VFVAFASVLVGVAAPLGAQEGTLLKARIEENVGDPFSNQREDIRYLELTLEADLDKGFQAEAKAKIEQAKATLQKYIKAAEEARRTFEDMSLARTQKEQERAAEQHSKAASAANALQQEFYKASEAAHGALGHAFKAQKVARDRAARAAALKRAEEAMKEPLPRQGRPSTGDVKNPDGKPDGTGARGGSPRGNTTSRTGADENQADPALVFISGALEGYNDALKQDLPNNVLLAPVNILGGKIKTVGKLLEIVGKAEALDALRQDIDQIANHSDPNETPKERAKRVGKLIYDALGAKDTFSGGVHSGGADAGGSPSSGGNAGGANASAARPGVPSSGGSGDALSPVRPGRAGPGSGATPRINEIGNGGGRIPSSDRYPGDFGPLPDTEASPRKYYDGQPASVYDVAAGTDAAKEALGFPYNDARSVWDQDAIAQPFKGIENPNGKTLGDRLGEFTKGQAGASVKELDLSGKSPREIDAALRDAGFSHRREGLPTTLHSGAVIEVPHDIYVHPDGGMVRVKPQGVPENKFRPQPHVSKSVLFDAAPKDGGWPDTRFENEAFKVANDGTPLPSATKSSYGFKSRGGQLEKVVYNDYLMDRAHTNLPPPKP
jgi:hypothetical protein